MDTSARRGRACGHGGSSRRRRLRSMRGGMARERGREACEVSAGSDGNVKPAQVSTGAGGKQVAPWRARARRRHLCACLARTKQLAGMGQHSAGPAR